MTRTPASASSGFTLIEMAIVLLIIGVAAALVLSTSGGMLDNQKRQAARTRLDAVEAALVNFVVINKRLPCPANGALASGAASAGVETLAANGSCNPTNQINGVVPWVTLGLSEGDASDPWDARLTYRVDPALAGGAPLPALMNMSQCDPAATGGVGASGICKVAAAPCTGSAACTSPSAFLSGKGLDVWDGQNGAAGWAARTNNSTNGTGAAWVIISAGPSGAGAFNRNGGSVQAGSVFLGKDLEEQNVNAKAIAKPATQANTYRDAPLNDNGLAYVPAAGPPPVPPLTQNHFDDYLSHPTLMSVLARANLAPRAH